MAREAKKSDGFDNTAIVLSVATQLKAPAISYQWHGGASAIVHPSDSECMK
jgi:hypothetical protein